MPISDNYCVQALLQSTQATARNGSPTLQWISKESEGFRTAAHGVQLDLDSMPTRGGPRLYLALSRDEDRVYVEEPLNEGNQSDADRELARLLRELFCRVAEQCSERARANEASPVRDALFRQALFGERESSAA